MPNRLCARIWSKMARLSILLLTSYCPMDFSLFAWQGPNTAPAQVFYRMHQALSMVQAAIVICGLAAFWVPAAQAATPHSAEQTAQQVCANCHGRQGESAGPAHAHLAGQNAAYITQQLRDFKSGKRDNRAMREMAAELSEAQLVAIGRYYASMKPVPHPVADPALVNTGRLLFTASKAQSGVAACAACHGAQGQGSSNLPRLAGQHPQYLKRQLENFGQREPTPEIAAVHDAASRLSEPDKHAVTRYLSALK